MGDVLLVVLAGRPGTGKTTLARLIAARLRAANVRIDAIETAVLRCGLAEPPIGPVGYVIAHEVATASLTAGADVVVDAVSPVPEARAGWRELAARAGARLVLFETTLPDGKEHRRRVQQRHPDLDGQRVPTWAEVCDGEYVPWDEARDGPRHVLDTTDADAALTEALGVIASA